ncbi:Uncharacterized protein APZ42_005097 [Daphnia magna]|uniref:Uncharacterized protein n=1 Tax=Daphnia magna TaxID=35525 RepID=A0A164GNC8_9CRUS|nr:Uncharacterized protein APZ42_005097 [Daphnia magna]
MEINTKFFGFVVYIFSIQDVNLHRVSKKTGNSLALNGLLKQWSICEYIQFISRIAGSYKIGITVPIQIPYRWFS